MHICLLTPTLDNYPLCCSRLGHPSSPYLVNPYTRTSCISAVVFSALAATGKGPGPICT